MTLEQVAGFKRPLLGFQHIATGDLWFAPGLQ